MPPNKKDQGKDSDGLEEEEEEEEYEDDQMVFVTVEASTQSVYPGADSVATPNDKMVGIGGGQQHPPTGIAVNDPIRLLPVIGAYVAYTYLCVTIWTCAFKNTIVLVLCSCLKLPIVMAIYSTNTYTCLPTYLTMVLDCHFLLLLPLPVLLLPVLLFFLFSSSAIAGTLLIELKSLSHSFS